MDIDLSVWKPVFPAKFLYLISAVLEVSKALMLFNVFAFSLRGVANSETTRNSETFKCGNTDPFVFTTARSPNYKLSLSKRKARLSNVISNTLK